MFTHVPPPHVPLIFGNVAKVFHDESILLATAAFSDGNEQIIDPNKWTDLPINLYSLTRLKDAASAAGLRLLRLGKAFQDWFVVFKDGNKTALRGAEQMSKVDWGAVLPPWQDPGWGQATAPASTPTTGGRPDQRVN